MIYESPDGGKTVTIRAPHTLTKQDLTPHDLEAKQLNELWFAWRDVLLASKTNPALLEALERAQIIYELSRRAV